MQVYECHLLCQVFDIYQGYTFEFIKALSDTVFDVVNPVYYDKPLILIYHYQAVNTNC